MKLENVKDVYPLSSMQEGMLFHSISAPESGAYIDQALVTLTGQLDQDRLSRSLRAVAARHDCLRTAFIWDGVDQPLQIVREEVDYIVDRLDWSLQSEGDPSKSLNELIVENRQRGFRLEDAPLIRFSICKRATDHLLIICFHHLILDGWATHALLQEIITHYEDPSSRAAVSFRFRDYIAWLGAQDHVGSLEFWKKELAGFDQPNRIGVPLSTDGTSSYSQVVGSISPELTGRLKEFARQSRVTLNTMFQAIWSLVISRYSFGDKDIVFGTTVSGRPLELPGIETAIGSFINTIPFRTVIDSNQTVTDWLEQIQNAQAARLEYDYASLADVQRNSDIAAGESLFDSILVFENYPAAAPNSGTVTINGVEHFEQSNYPLALIAVPGETTGLFLVFDEARYSTGFAADLVEYVDHLASFVVENQTGTIRDLIALPQSQVDRLAEWNRSEGGFEDARKTTPVHEIVAGFAAENPDAVAAVFAGRQYTYSELDKASDRLARLLLERGVTGGDVVGLCVDRSFEMLMGIFGILKSGAAYLPLDAMYPREHFEYVLDDASARCVLATRESAALLPAGDFKLIYFDEIGKADSAVSIPKVELNDAAYLIYTSGSTGKPKGVAISHGNLAASNAARFEYYSRSPSRYLLLSSFAFDSSVAGIFWTLTNGGALVLPEPGGEQDVEALLGLIETHDVSHLLCLPTLYRLLLEAATWRVDSIQSLSTAIVAGEALSGDVVRSHFETVPHAELHNEYGPTEGTVWATAYCVTRDDVMTGVPIGRSIPGSEIHLLDGEQRPVGIGAEGEVYFSGPGVASGYLNQPETSMRKFMDVNMPGGPYRMYRTGDVAYYREDGQLVFAGRADSQVKIRGYRIELDEIETRVRAVDKVRDAVVVAAALAENGPPKILAYVTGEADEQTIRTELSDQLAAFMLPDRYLFLDSFPRLSNGKVDRKSLPLPDAGTLRDDFVAPRDETEEKLAAIWMETIGVDRVGVHDNFFALGGDSIISIRMISRARREGIRLQPKQIADFPTVARLAAVCRGNEDSVADSIDPTQPFPLSPIQRWFFDQHMPEPHHWNMSTMFEFPEVYDPDRAAVAIESVVKSHPMLSASFRKTGEGSWTQSVDPHREHRLETRDVTGLRDDQIESLCLESQASLDLATGPLVRLLRLTAKDRRDRLLFVVHHLVMDAVSWSIVTDDINHAYATLSSGKEFKAEDASSSYASFVASLIQSVETRKQERGYWSKIGRDISPFSFDTPSAGPVTSVSVRSLTCEISTETTLAIRGSANKALNTNTRDLILSALAMAVSGHCGDTRVLMDLESHGRDAAAELDLTRTVGWFTSVFPIELNVRPGDVRSTVQSVKEHLRDIPGGGAGSGILRYLAGDDGGDRSGQEEPRILFNFLGIRTESKEEVLLQACDGANNTSRHLQSTGGHPLEINATICGDRLIMEWRWCSRLFHDETIERLADECSASLDRIVEQLDDSRAGFTPSDFPDAGLSQSELDDLLDDLD